VSTDAATNKGLVIQGVISQTANLLEFQDVSGNTVSSFDSTGGLVLGRSTADNGNITFLNSTNSNSVVLDSLAVTGARVVSLPDATGTICLENSMNCGFLTYATGAFTTDSSLNDTLAINKTGASGNIIALQKNGGAVFTVANTGSLQIQDTSSTALDIRNTGGTSYFTVDTSTGTTTIQDVNIAGKITGAGLVNCNGLYDVLQWDSVSSTFSCKDASPVVIQVYDNTGGTNLNAATATAIPFGAETTKSIGYTHDTVINNNQITLDNAGWYRLDYNVSSINGGNGRITARCEARLNGTTIINQSRSYSYLRSATDNNGTNTAGFLFQTTTPNEYVEIMCARDGSGGTSTSIANETWLTIERR